MLPLLETYRWCNYGGYCTQSPSVMSMPFEALEERNNMINVAVHIATYGGSKQLGGCITGETVNQKKKSCMLCLSTNHTNKNPDILEQNTTEAINNIRIKQ